jgi:hypothetical protein
MAKARRKTIRRIPAAIAVLDELKRLSKDGLHAPTPRQFTRRRAIDVPGTHWIKQVFGTYARAVEEAGLVPTPTSPEPKRQYDKETIIPAIVAELLRLSQDGTHMPAWERYRKFRNSELPTPEWISKNIAGGFKRLQKETGLLPPSRQFEPTPASIALGKPLTADEKSAHKRRVDAEQRAMERGGLPVSHTYEKERHRPDGTVIVETWHVLR